MPAKVLIFLLTIVLFSCETDIEKNKSEKTIKTNYSFGMYQHIRVYEIDSCEYIGFSGTSDGGTAIIHKQNCKFCAERNKKQ